MKKLFISHPTTGLTEQEIRKLRQCAWDYAEQETGQRLSPIPYERKPDGLENVGDDLRQIADADYVIFPAYFGAYRRCRIAQMAAACYEKKCIYMKEL